MAWGSFLNVVACSLLAQASLLTWRRSCCPVCSSQIAWYDLIPLISWLILRGSCRACRSPISYLYPFIELLTALVFGCMVILVDPSYWFAYGLLSSALIVTVRTDLEAMAVSRLMSLYLVPVGWLLSLAGFLPISIFQSIVGALSAYAFLYVLGYLFYRWKKVEGLGLGDVELLACVGAFLGVLGWWIALVVGATVGSLFGISYMVVRNDKNRYIRIPFCPFIALGTWIYMFWPHLIMRLMGLV